MPQTIYDPPALAPGTLRVTPVGGLGEVGRNMTVFEYDGRLLIVDCGVLFPEDFQPGVDLILPDFDYIRDRLDRVEAIVLTHGHEDHIGAVPYLLREKADIPIVGSRLTLALLEAKLQEHRIKPYSLEVREGDRERFGSFDCEFVAVNHSIPTLSRWPSGHRRAWCCTPATSRWTSCRWTGASPTCGPSRASVRRVWTCS